MEAMVDVVTNEAGTAPVTLQEAERTITYWQDELNRATAAVDEYQRQLGQLALAGGATNATRELARLRDDVTIAQQAVVAANAQREVARKADRVKRAEALEAKIKGLNAEIAHQEAIHKEHAPLAEQAWRQIESLNTIVSSLEHSLMNLQNRIAEDKRNG